MCEFNHEDSKLIELKYKDAIIGGRFWKYNIKENKLESLHRSFEFESKKEKSNKPNLNGDLGFYSYSYYYYNNNYYNNNYYYYYYKNNNNYYYNNNNYYYYIAGIIKNYGTTVIHKFGQRSEKIEIVNLFTLKNHIDEKFLEHFNNSVNKIAKTLKVSTMPFQYGENPIEEYNKLIAYK